MFLLLVLWFRTSAHDISPIRLFISTAGLRELRKWKNSTNLKQMVKVPYHTMMFRCLKILLYNYNKTWSAQTSMSLTSLKHTAYLSQKCNLLNSQGVIQLNVCILLIWYFKQLLSMHFFLPRFAQNDRNFELIQYLLYLNLFHYLYPIFRPNTEGL